MIRRRNLAHDQTRLIRQILVDLRICARTAGVRTQLRAARVDVAVINGAEVALSEATELHADVLRTLCLGGGPYLLVESPYSYAGPELESALAEIQLRGFKPVLAHPERSAARPKP